MGAPKRHSRLQAYIDRFADARTSGLVLNTAVGPLAINAAAQSGAESDLINRTGRPILIDSIKIHCGLYDGWGADASKVGTVLTDALNCLNNFVGNPFPDDAFILSESPLRALFARFTLGGVLLSRDFVPVYGLSGGWDLRSSALVVVWTPSVPIYVEDGEFLRPELRYQSYPAPAIVNPGVSIPNPQATPQVTYVCRVLEDPKDWLSEKDERVLPYVTNFSPAPLAMFQLASVQSSDSDLMNPFDDDLYVDKMVGNTITQIFDALIGNLETTLQALGGNAAPGPLGNIPEIGVKVRMEDSRGLSLVKDPIPFSHLFNAVDSVWWMNTKLGPREFFRIFLDVDFTNGNIFMNDGSVVTPSITMHGVHFTNEWGQATRWHQKARDMEYAGVAQRINARTLRGG